jgi:hypothetical protein
LPGDNDENIRELKPSQDSNRMPPEYDERARNREKIWKGIST